jgi:hypothetical protein
VLDIWLASKNGYRQHLLFPDERVFIDIFASEDVTGVSDGTDIPRLKIQRLGPLVHTQQLEMSVWLAQEPCEACVHRHPNSAQLTCHSPLSIRSLDILVSVEHPVHGCDKLGGIEVPTDNLRDLSLRRNNGVYGSHNLQASKTPYPCWFVISASFWSSSRPHERQQPIALDIVNMHYSPVRRLIIMAGKYEKRSFSLRVYIE